MKAKKPFVAINIKKGIFTIEEVLKLLRDAGINYKLINKEDQRKITPPPSTGYTTKERR